MNQRFLLSFNKDGQADLEKVDAEEYRSYIGKTAEQWNWILFTDYNFEKDYLKNKYPELFI